MYDVENNPISTFKFLTPDHFDITSAGKMRNYLADDVLGKKMLEVIQVSQLLDKLRFISNRSGIETYPTDQK